MEKARISQEVMITLLLTPKEAIFLKTYLQNWMHNDEEPEDMKAMRINTFHALPEFEELYKYL